MTDTMNPAEIAAVEAELTHDRLILRIARAIGTEMDDPAVIAAALVIIEFAAHDENTTRTAARAVDDNPIAYRSVTRDVRVWATCNGVNHSDGGEIVTHDRCGAEVIIREDGRILDVVRVGAYGARRFQCWRGAHECTAAAVEAVAMARVQAADAGEIVKGCMVVVARGRKVPKGTTGRVFWVGESVYGTKQVGVMAADGVKHFTAATNCDRV